MTTEDLIAYYKGLLIMQYSALGNALGEIDLWIRLFVQNQIVSQVRDAFDVLTATGAQLNILGAYRGISRILFGATPAANWSLIPYADAAPNSYFGWGVYADVTPPVGQWLQYADLDNLAYSLSDIQMRTLIRLRAAFQSWDGSLGSLDNILYTFFGTYVNVMDNENMTITYQHQSADPDPNSIWDMAVIAGILPHNAGVSYTTVEV